MDIWGLISAFLISQYWGWILLILAIVICFTYPIFGLCMLALGVLIVLLIYVIDKFQAIKCRQVNKAWDLLPKDVKTDWQKVRLSRKNMIGDMADYTGRSAFVQVFEENYSFWDYFRSQIKKFPEIPRSNYYSRGPFKPGFMGNKIFFISSKGVAIPSVSVEPMIEMAKKEGAEGGKLDNLEKEIRGVAWKLRQKGERIDFIAKATGLSREDVKGLTEKDEFVEVNYYMPSKPKSEDDAENMIYAFTEHGPELTEKAKALLDFYKMGEWKKAKKERWDKERLKIASRLNRMGVNPNIIQECTGSMGYMYVDD